MAPARPGIMHRFLSVFRPRHPQVQESKDGPDISSPPFAPPPYVADEKQDPSPSPATNAQNATLPRPPTPSTSSQLYIRQYLSDARTTRTKLIQSFKTIKSLGHCPTAEGALLSNRKENVDNMRRFLRYWLEREYLPEPSGRVFKDTYTSQAHYTHILNLSRLLFYLIPFQNLHGWTPTDAPLKNEIWAYVKATLRAPLQALDIDEPHVVQALQYFYQCEGLNPPRRVGGRVHEQFARDGWFEVLRANIAADREMLAKVVEGDERDERGLLVRETLVKAITDTRAMYFASGEDGSQAFSPSYLLTDYAKKNLCPSCRGSTGPRTTAEPLKDHLGGERQKTGAGPEGVRESTSQSHVRAHGTAENGLRISGI